MVIFISFLWFQSLDFVFGGFWVYGWNSHDGSWKKLNFCLIFFIELCWIRCYAFDVLPLWHNSPELRLVVHMFIHCSYVVFSFAHRVFDEMSKWHLHPCLGSNECLALGINVLWIVNHVHSFIHSFLTLFVLMHFCLNVYAITHVCALYECMCFSIMCECLWFYLIHLVVFHVIHSCTHSCLSFISHTS